MNTFDFWMFSVYKDRIGDFKGSKITRAEIKSEFKGWKVYGSGMYAKRFKTYWYKATIGYLDAPGTTHADVDAYATKLEEEYGIKGVIPQYVARD